MLVIDAVARLIPARWEMKRLHRMNRSARRKTRPGTQSHQPRATVTDPRLSALHAAAEYRGWSVRKS